MESDLWPSCFFCAGRPVATVELLPLKASFRWPSLQNHYSSLSDFITAPLGFPVGCPNLSARQRTAPLSRSCCIFQTIVHPRERLLGCTVKDSWHCPPKELPGVPVFKGHSLRVGMERGKKKGADILEPLQGARGTNFQINGKMKHALCGCVGVCVCLSSQRLGWMLTGGGNLGHLISSSNPSCTLWIDLFINLFSNSPKCAIVSSQCARHCSNWKYTSSLFF